MKILLFIISLLATLVTGYCFGYQAGSISDTHIYHSPKTIKPGIIIIHDTLK